MASKPPTRGQLLRAILQTAVELRNLEQLIRSAEIEVTAASETKNDLQLKIVNTDAELVVLRAQHSYESSNDRELVQLQRANNVMALRKQELARITMIARSERDKSKSEQTSAYYTRLGAALEHTRLLGSLGAPILVPSHFCGAERARDSSAQLLLQSEVDALWRKAAVSSVAVKDAASAALAFAGEPPDEAGPLYPLLDAANNAEAGGPKLPTLSWMPSAQAAAASTANGSAATSTTAATTAAGSRASDPPSIPGAPGYLAYASLGQTALTADATRAIEVVGQLGAEHAALCLRLQACMRATDKGVESAPAGETGCIAGTGLAVIGEGESPGETLSLVAACCHTQLALIRQNLDMQLVILDFVHDDAAKAGATSGPVP
jgi:hypothetical protein